MYPDNPILLYCCCHSKPVFLFCFIFQRIIVTGLKHMNPIINKLDSYIWRLALCSVTAAVQPISPVPLLPVELKTSDFIIALWLGKYYSVEFFIETKCGFLKTQWRGRHRRRRSWQCSPYFPFVSFLKVIEMPQCQHIVLGYWERTRYDWCRLGLQRGGTFPVYSKNPRKMWKKNTGKFPKFTGHFPTFCNTNADL